MITLDRAREFVKAARAWAAAQPVRGSLLAEFLLAACRYAQLRVEWELGDREDRVRLDEPRRLAHDAFIAACNALSRMMGHPANEWRRHVGDVREDLGDFACLVHAALGLAAR